VSATTTQQALKVGQRMHDRQTGQAVQICKVTADFIEWRDEATLGHGRMMRCHFRTFYQENHPHEQ